MHSLKYVDNGDSFTVPFMPETIRCFVAPGEGLLFLSTENDSNPANVELIWQGSDLVLQATRDIFEAEVLRLPEGVLRVSGRSRTEHWLTVSQAEIWELCQMHDSLRANSKKPVAADACEDVFGQPQANLSLNPHALVLALPHDYKEGMFASRVVKVLLDLEECMRNGRGYEHCTDSTSINVTRVPLDKVYGRGLYEVMLGVMEMEFERQTGFDLRLIRKDPHDNNYPVHNLFALPMDQDPHFDSIIDFEDGGMWSFTFRWTEGSDTAFLIEDPGLDLNELFRQVSAVKDLGEQACKLATLMAKINDVLKQMKAGKGMAKKRRVRPGTFVAFRASRVPHYGRKGVNRVTLYGSGRPANAPEHPSTAGLRTAEDVYRARDFTFSESGAKRILEWLGRQLPSATLCSQKALYQAMQV